MLYHFVKYQTIVRTEIEFICVPPDTVVVVAYTTLVSSDYVHDQDIHIFNFVFVYLCVITTTSLSVGMEVVENMLTRFQQFYR